MDVPGFGVRFLLRSSCLCVVLLFCSHYVWISWWHIPTRHDIPPWHIVMVYILWGTLMTYLWVLGFNMGTVRYLHYILTCHDGISWWHIPSRHDIPPWHIIVGYTLWGTLITYLWVNMGTMRYLHDIRNHDISQLYILMMFVHNEILYLYSHEILMNISVMRYLDEIVR